MPSVQDWAAKAARRIKQEPRGATEERIAVIIATFAEPLIMVVRESARPHYHRDDYCCGKCTHPVHGLCDDGEDHEHDAACYVGSHDGAAAQMSGVCSCGADAWNARIDAALYPKK